VNKFFNARTVAIAAIIASSLLTGCASIVNGTNQVVSVETRNKGEMVNGASCTLANGKGVFYVTTPGTVTLHRAYENLSVKCEKANTAPGLATVKSSTKGMAFGNILFGGVIGVAVDAGTGAAYDYPSLITVLMGEDTQIPSTTGSTNAAAPVLRNPQTASLVSNQAVTVAMIKSHHYVVPQDTGWATIDNIDAVPIRAEGKDRFRHYLTLKSPKVFVVHNTGSWRFWSNDSESIAKALQFCSQQKNSCSLYAVDDRVVWHDDISKRIGKLEQVTLVK
jgi:hypothetical protein